ncbi:C1q-related factor-like [Mya arenaria]|uniref:C1q-related factor-like n=1 Tax=Mya arenaria TaxID=6604 RepID=UPI0022E545CB|nr:C1q-related factor-like [Mya arenaria]
MSNRDFHRVLLQMLVILTLYCKCPGSTEPRCSRFQFEERMLEKLIRLEVAMEQMKDQTSVTGNRLENCMHEMDRLTLDLNDAKDEHVELKKDLANFKTGLLNSIEEKSRVPTILFKATKVSNKTPNQGQIIVFKETLSNYGNGYDNNTGIFDAPVSGSYFFTVHLCPEPGAYIVSHLINGGRILTTDSNYDKDGLVCNTSEAVVYLEKQSKVWVEIFNSEPKIKEDYHRFSYFTGVILHI